MYYLEKAYFEIKRVKFGLSKFNLFKINLREEYLVNMKLSVAYSYFMVLI